MGRDKDEEKNSNPAEEQEPRSDFVNLFKRGLKFTEELMAENEKLRYQVADLNTEATDASTDDDAVRSLKEEIAALRQERNKLQENFTSVESQSADYKERYNEIEDEYNRLANLYIASFQLHSTVGFREFVQVVAEIIINLIGVSHFTLYLRDAKSDFLHPLLTEGHKLSTLPSIKMGEGLIGKVASSRSSHIENAQARQPGTPLAIIALATREMSVGVIVIDDLLIQKQSFTNVDEELFSLLGAHAATGLVTGLLMGARNIEDSTDILNIDGARALLAGD